MTRYSTGIIDAAAPDILIVDDHEMTARSLAMILQSAGYSIAMVHNGVDAIARVESSSPRCAVIDIHLPDLNGLVLSSKLREKLGPDVPILVFSGDTSLETIRTLPHVGATYFLSKPVNATHLLEVIRNWLPNSRQHLGDGKLGSDGEMGAQPA